MELYLVLLLVTCVSAAPVFEKCLPTAPSNSLPSISKSFPKIGFQLPKAGHQLSNFDPQEKSKFSPQQIGGFNCPSEREGGCPKGNCETTPTTPCITTTTACPTTTTTEPTTTACPTTTTTEPTTTVCPTTTPPTTTCSRAPQLPTQAPTQSPSEEGEKSTNTVTEKSKPKLMQDPLTLPPAQETTLKSELKTTESPSLEKEPLNSDKSSEGGEKIHHPDLQSGQLPTLPPLGNKLPAACPKRRKQSLLPQSQESNESTAHIPDSTKESLPKPTPTAKTTEASKLDGETGGLSSSASEQTTCTCASTEHVPSLLNSAQSPPPPPPRSGTTAANNDETRQVLSATQPSKGDEGEEKSRNNNLIITWKPNSSFPTLPPADKNIREYELRVLDKNDKGTVAFKFPPDTPNDLVRKKVTKTLNPDTYKGDTVRMELVRIKN